MTRVMGVVMIVVALVLAIAPIFTDCESAGRTLTTADGRSVSMKCHWAGIAEVGAAVSMGIAGIYALRSRRKDTTRMAALFGVAAGVIGILMPTVLIGTCGTPTMPCNVLMRPILLLTGIVGIVAAVTLFGVAHDAQPPVTPSMAA